MDAGFFAKGTTYDASEGGGSSEHCVANVQKGWEILHQLGATKEGKDTITVIWCAGITAYTLTNTRACVHTGRSTLHSALRLCPASKLNTEADVIGLRDFLASAWDTMAMGNFPYPSGWVDQGGLAAAGGFVA